VMIGTGGSPQHEGSSGGGKQGKFAHERSFVSER
jgi:hypothetical protein